MFSWLKRWTQPPAPPRKRSRSSSARKVPALVPQPLNTAPGPVPQVLAEGNSQADWSEWENSMTELDSHIGELSPTSRIYERDSDSRYTKPAPLHEDADAFGRVGKNRDS